VEFAHFESVTGQGVKGRCERGELLLGRREWVATARGDQAVAQVPATGGGFLGNLVEQRRIARAHHVARRHPAAGEGWWTNSSASGLRTLVLTGDRRAAGEHLKTELHLDEVRAELKPEEKVAAIKSLSDGK
jgi:Cd2+/Zn2+-exporting ATPase